MENTEPNTQKSATGQMEPNPRSKHTPGPWDWCPRLSASENHKGFAVFQNVAGGGLIADVLPMNNSKGDPSPKATANARLIAAAPELLAAYKRCIPDWVIDEKDYDGHIASEITNADVRALIAAIAKAEGAPSVQERNEVL